MAYPSPNFDVPQFGRMIESRQFESPRHQEATAAIAHSELGQRFLHYLYDPAGAQLQSQLLNRVIEQTFKKRGKSITAQSALYFLIAEIYKMGAFGTEQFHRLQLFESAMMERQATGPIYLGKHITTITIIVALMAVVVGFYQGSVKAAYKYFFPVLGPISFMYFFWADQVQRARGNSLFDEIKSSGNDRRWHDFVRELEKL